MKCTKDDRITGNRRSPGGMTLFLGLIFTLALLSTACGAQPTKRRHGDASGEPHGDAEKPDHQGSGGRDS